MGIFGTTERHFVAIQNLHKDDEREFQTFNFNSLAFNCETQ